MEESANRLGRARLRGRIISRLLDLVLNGDALIRITLSVSVRRNESAACERHDAVLDLRYSRMARMRPLGDLTDILD